MLFCSFYYIFYGILHDKCIFVDVFLNHNNLKFKFLTLSKTKITPALKRALNLNNNLFCCFELNQNKSFLTTLSKFVDFKTQNNKNTYRAKENFVLIDESCRQLISELKLKPNIFKNYKMLNNKFKFRQKENKVLKILLAKHILIKIAKLKKETDDLLKIINLSKNAKCVKFYQNTTHYYSQIYSFCNFNKNKTKLLNHSKPEIDYMIKRLFNQLYAYKKQFSILINYLIVMFN